MVIVAQAAVSTTGRISASRAIVKSRMIKTPAVAPFGDQYSGAPEETSGRGRQRRRVLGTERMDRRGRRRAARVGQPDDRRADRGRPAGVERRVRRGHRATAARAFQTWRERPAPKRGELVRDLGNALREHKEPLGDLVTLEMGKIRTEGHGEVQEMIDICDFAVGLSRQLYGLTLTSERPGHRMMEQWHPLGPVGVITAFNFPVAVWSWNAALAAVCGDPVIWKPAEPTPLTAVAVQHIANRVMADHGVTGDLHAASSARAGSSASACSPTSACRWSRSPARPRSAGAWPRSSRRGSAARSSSSAATTRSSSRRTRTSISRCAPSSLARSARPASAARRTRRIIVAPGDRAGARRARSRAPTRRCRSAIRWTPAR